MPYADYIHRFFHWPVSTATNLLGRLRTASKLTTTVDRASFAIAFTNGGCVPLLRRRFYRIASPMPRPIVQLHSTSWPVLKRRGYSIPWSPENIVMHKVLSYVSANAWYCITMANIDYNCLPHSYCLLLDEIQ